MKGNSLCRPCGAVNLISAKFCRICGSFNLDNICPEIDNEAGIKHDQDKPKMELLDPYAIEQLALVLTFGAKKYGQWNWAKGLSYSRLIGAALRHLFAFAAGQDKDDESGLPHLSHCFCCLMMLVAMTKRHPNLDDRNNGLDNE